MSWVDLSALAIVLWGAAKGYLSGVLKAAAHFLGLLAALVLAVFCHRPLALFLHTEWQIESVFVGWIAGNADSLQEAWAAGTRFPSLSPVAGRIMSMLVPSADVAAVSTRETALTVLGAMLGRLLALLLFFVFAFALISLVLRIRYDEARGPKRAEWERLSGLLAGAAHGLLAALVLAIVTDAFSLFTVFSFLRTDLYESYLFQLAAAILQHIF